jgi:hypothetical protein
MNRYMVLNYRTDNKSGGLGDVVALCNTEREVYIIASSYVGSSGQIQEVLDMGAQRYAYIDRPPPFEWRPLENLT